MDLSHYDVTERLRVAALAHGAVPVDAQRSAAILRAAGARRVGVA